MSKSKLQEAEQILDIVRQLISVIKDGSIPEDEADKMVGKLLVKIDNAMQRYDQGLDPIASVADNPMKGKMKIESPKRKKT